MFLGAHGKYSIWNMFSKFDISGACKCFVLGGGLKPRKEGLFTPKKGFIKGFQVRHIHCFLTSSSNNIISKPKDCVLLNGRMNPRLEQWI